MLINLTKMVKPEVTHTRLLVMLQSTQGDLGQSLEEERGKVINLQQKVAVLEGQLRAKRTEAEAQEAAIEAANKTSARQKHAATSAKQKVQTLENDLAEAQRQQLGLRSENQKLKKSLDEQVRQSHG